MQKLVELIRSTSNRGKTHVFLGHPLADVCDKTTVEPGGGYSPGALTCGLSLWIEYEGELYTPDLLDYDKISWCFGNEKAFSPVLRSSYDAGDKLSVEAEIAYLGGEGSEGADFNLVKITAKAPCTGRVYIVVRGEGPAGGVIKKLEWIDKESVLVINDSIRLTTEQKPLSCDIMDNVSGRLALLQYKLQLSADEIFKLAYKTEHGFGLTTFGEHIPVNRPYKKTTIEEGFDSCIREWREAVPAGIFCPDKTIVKAWKECIFHILSAMETGMPRIGVMTYPIFWIRDCVIVMRALDLTGRHDLARIGNEYLADLYFGGGFGAEADAPGEGIWSLVSHARITRDTDWLEKVFPSIQKRVSWIKRMIEAEKPIRVVADSRNRGLIGSPGVNILCMAAQNGTIHGRMDWHFPDFYINCWSYAGLRLGADAAELLGHNELAKHWNDEASRLEENIRTYLLPTYGNERDPIVTPYPTGALSGNHEELAERFREWFLRERLTPEGTRKPEDLWTYFEAAQIHNAFLLGMKEEAWKVLPGFLTDLRAANVSAFWEGEPKGSLIGGNMPHNWTTSEVVNMLRTIFITEEDGYIILGKGVPDEWLKPGLSFGVSNMPTDYGKVSYTVETDALGKRHLDYNGPNNYKVEFGGC